ncbi:MAG: 23S rRNA (uridine(2552)-2'-O)-methyltransferase RlmE [Gammaproteobacteria bacterium]|nr:23S rRNA (uridine(2552)-2'-O)-methyltransferase RlmE [Gammaproteobacteria bacterium]MBQ0840003.1 23S rRNA (uridine(2552)-2'-O)-methyltransferase RlmE [Gammaproteobacteria bacterium]
MAKSKTSKAWLKEHESDEYVQRSRKDGYRSRASYKLLEIDKSAGLLKPGMTVVDLGAAPGGWSQVSIAKVGDSGRVVASDILNMDAIAGVDFVQGDFTDDEVFSAILQTLDDRAVDLVISDMAPNMSGMKAVDQPRAMYLVELAVDFARQVLCPGGVFLAKVFQGEGFDALVRDLRVDFSSVAIKKPDASRARSSEVYCLARGFRGDV